VNTGWVGGQYGVGKRISIRYTRAMLNAALGGKLRDVEFKTDPIFGFQVPTTCPDVPDSVLDPATSWPNRELYRQRYTQLAARFIDNFKKFDTAEAREVEKAGPKL
jgi:phosphoenolpyruvate carboxykinase (ATP)